MPPIIAGVLQQGAAGKYLFLRKCNSQIPEERVVVNQTSSDSLNIYSVHAGLGSLCSSSRRDYGRSWRRWI